jgi:hypothetical protein
MLKRFELPPTVHDHAPDRVWNRRGYDMNVWSEKKIQEKLNYMQNNPVKRGLAAQPRDWPWSRRGGEVLLPEAQFCFDYGPDSLRCNCERSHGENRGAGIQTNVRATRANRRSLSKQAARERRVQPWHRALWAGKGCDRGREEARSATFGREPRSLPNYDKISMEKSEPHGP